MNITKMENDSTTSTVDEVDIPDNFICPLTLEIIREPVLSKYGHTFEKSAIVEWLASEETCPLTRRPLNLRGIIVHHKLRQEIADWRRENNALVLTAEESEEFCAFFTIPSTFAVAAEVPEETPTSRRNRTSLSSNVRRFVRRPRITRAALGFRGMATASA